MGYPKKRGKKDGMPKKHDPKKREKNWTHQGPRKKEKKKKRFIKGERDS